MKRQRDFAGNSFGLLAMALIALASALLFGMWSMPQRIAGASEPTLTQDMTSPSPTEMPTPVFRAENIKIVKEVQLTADGKYPGLPFGLSWSPSGGQLLFTKVTEEFITSPTGFTPVTDIWIINSDGSSPRRLATGSQPVWAPDGEKIAYTKLISISQTANQSEVWEMDIESGEKSKQVDIDGYGLAWLSNNDIVYEHNKHIRSVNIVDTTQRQLVDQQIQRDGSNSFAISSEGKRIAIVDLRDLWLIDLDKMVSQKLTDRFDNVLGGLIWSPDGKKLAYTADRAIWIMRVNEVEQLKVYEHLGRGVPWALSWSPDGNVLAFNGYDGIYVVNADSTGLRNLVEIEDAKGPFAPVWSPDGLKLAVEKMPEVKKSNLRDLWVIILKLD